MIGIKPAWPKYISWFPDIGLDDRPKVGGKGGSLGELQRAGINVPPGFVVRTEAFEGFIDALERRAPLRARVEALAADDLEGIGAVSRELRARIEDAPLPADLQQEIRDAYATLGRVGAPPAVAVRSSATTEDAADASFAGLQDTYLWVTQTDSVMRKIRSCWASLYSLESLSYRRRHGIAESTVAMAVVVQTMVDARTAGVMFTRSPVSGDRSVITIEGAWGLGSALVGGEVTPDRWVVAKITGEISVRDISDKAIRHAQVAGRRCRGACRGGISAPRTLPVRPGTATSLRSHRQTDRAPLRPAAGHRVGRRAAYAADLAAAEPARDGLVEQGESDGRGARAASDPLLHVMRIFGGRR